MAFKSEMTFEDSLAHLRSIDGDNFYDERDVQKLWASLIGADLGLLQRMYDLYFSTVRALLEPTSGSEEPRLADAYKFIQAFSSSQFLSAMKARPEAWRLLQARHEEHADLVKRAMKRADHKVVDKHQRLQTGNWGDIPGAMLELYGWHAPFGPEGDPIRSEMAVLLPEFYRAFPKQQNFILGRMLQHHPDGPPAIADLIRFYLLERGTLKEGPIEWLAGDMLGHFAEKRDSLHTQSSQILGEVLRDAKSWPDTTVDMFIEQLVLTPLRVETYSHDTAIARKKDSVANQRRIINEGRYRAEFGISVESQKQRDEEYLRKAEAELALIETNFDEWNAERRRKAVRRIAVSSGTRKALKTVAQKIPAAHRSAILGLLEEAESYASRPKQFPMPKPAENRFKDFGLKLLVIEELMYRQKVLTPQFDIHAFAEEYEKREISVEADGYDIIPEAERYFRNLAISDDDLARVETLHQSSGLDGGAQFLRHLFPFWDPGVGDEPIRVTDKAIADLALLPNLKQISGLENSKPSAKLLKALTTCGITLIDEEDA